MHLGFEIKPNGFSRKPAASSVRVTAAAASGSGGWRRLARVVAQWDHSRRQPKQRRLDGLAGLLGSASPLSPAVVTHLELEEPLAKMSMPHHREVVLQARAEPHDVGRVPVVPGWPCNTPDVTFHICNSNSCHFRLCLEETERKTRNKSIKFLKVKWSHHSDGEATWEREDHLRSEYPEFFSSPRSRDEILS